VGFLARIGVGFKKWPAFFNSVWAELKKVRWPNRKEMISYTSVVMVTVVVIAVFFFIIDLGVSKLIELILGR
jgi:preprotein translocase subunit SecE